MSETQEYIKIDELQAMVYVLRNNKVYSHNQLLEMTGEEILEAYNDYILNEEE